MKTEHMLHKEVSCLYRRRKLLEWHKLDRLEEAVNDGKHHCITLGLWESRDKVQGDMGPGTPRSRQGLYNNPARAWCEDFPLAHTEQEARIPWCRGTWMDTRIAGGGGEGCGQPRGDTLAGKSGPTGPLSKLS